MDKPVIHPLCVWRLSRGFSLGDAARAVGTAKQTWSDWEASKRIPREVFMNRIYQVTRGKVRADSFYWPGGYPPLSTVDPNDRGKRESNDRRRPVASAVA
jgi:transcriptional regulator with XRE-family HTH domain